MDVFKLCDAVRETGFAIHRYLRNGHIEKIYENALAHRLQKRGFRVAQHHPLQVCDEDGFVLGSFFAGIFLEETLIIKLKAVAHVLDEHVAQLLGYLRASRVEHGVLVNFGAPKFHIRKYALRDAPPPNEGEIEPPSF
jgi:GxxExxY protein